MGLLPNLTSSDLVWQRPQRHCISIGWLLVHMLWMKSKVTLPCGTSFEVHTLRKPQGFILECI